MLAASSQPSGIAVDINQHSYQELEVSGWGRNVGFPWKTPAFMGAVGRLRACLSVAQSALFLSRKKMGKLVASSLNLGPNSVS